MAINGVSRQLIADAKCGEYVEPENIEAFTLAVRNFAADADLRKQQGENGYQFVRSHFDRKVLAQKYLDEITRRLQAR